MSEDRIVAMNAIVFYDDDAWSKVEGAGIMIVLEDGMRLLNNGASPKNIPPDEVLWSLTFIESEIVSHAIMTTNLVVTLKPEDRIIG